MHFTVLPYPNLTTRSDMIKLCWMFMKCFLKRYNSEGISHIIEAEAGGALEMGNRRMKCHRQESKLKWESWKLINYEAADVLNLAMEWNQFGCK